jgi:hypothetical protein
MFRGEDMFLVPIVNMPSYPGCCLDSRCFYIPTLPLLCFCNSPLIVRSILRCSAQKQ